MRARALALAACSLALLGEAPPAPAAPGPVDARAWAVLDIADDSVVGAMSGREPMPIASATKVMTALVALDRLDPDVQVPIHGYEAGAAESVAGLREGDSLSTEDLLYALLLASANDAAVELARASARSVDEFVRLMNAKARRLGLRQTGFANPIGFDDPDNHSSAIDLARMSAELRRDDLAARIVDTESRTLRSGLEPITVENRNALVGRVGWVDGVKTGQTLGAGWVLVASGTRKGVSLVAVILGASSEESRDQAALDLLRWGFGRYRSQTLAEKGETAGEARVEHGQPKSLQLEVARALSVPIRKGMQVDLRLEAPETVEGPIDRGERLGRLSAFAGDRRLGAVPVVAARSVAAPSLADRVPGAAIVVMIAVGLLVIIAGVVGVRRRGQER